MTMPTESDLEAYLDEALPPEEMAAVEHALRKDRKLAETLSAILARRGSGAHSLGEIWREHRLSCPTREQLGSFLLGALPEALAQHIAVHLRDSGCRYCQASLADLEAQQAESNQNAQTRRNKFFQSSAGYLKPKTPKKTS